MKGGHIVSNKNKTIITVALTGSLGSKDRNPHTPVTPDEIIEDAYQCYLEGASVVHIHVKGEDETSSSIDYDKFNYIREGIRKKCDIIINFSTSGEANVINGLDLIGTADADQEKRIGILNCEPDIATFDVPTMNFDTRIFMNPIAFLKKLGVEMKERSILPEVELYSVADVHVTKSLMEEGYLPDDVFYQLCLGIKGGTPATVKDLVYLHDALPKESAWSAFGVGKNHLSILYATLALGGHVRVGLEDNLYYEKGRLASNQKLVQRAARVIKEYGNEIATPEEARAILKIKKEVVI